jgi:hypothetical protein
MLMSDENENDRKITLAGSIKLNWSLFSMP